MRHTPDTDLTTEQVLEAVLVATLRELDLAGTRTELGLPVPADTDTPVEISGVLTFARAGVLTLDHGVYLELTDGSAYTLTLAAHHDPDPTHPDRR